MKVINVSKNTILGNNISIANSFISRFIGLMFRKTLSNSEGLIINPCNSIHMFFMNFAIDVIFVNQDNQIIHIIQNLKPWKISKIVYGSKYVIELPVDSISNTNTELGDKITIVK